MQLNLSLNPSNSTHVAKSFSFQRIPETSIIVWFRDLAEIFRYEEDDFESRNRMIYTLVEGNHISQRRVADALGLSPSLLRKIMKRMRASGGLVIHRQPRGSARVLTDEFVAVLNEKLSQGQMLSELADEYGVCLSTLRKGVTRGVLRHPIPHPELTLSSFGGKPIPQASTPFTQGEDSCESDTRGARASIDLKAAERLGMGCVRVLERTLGLMAGMKAHSQFEASEALSWGGVLLGVPALCAEGLFRSTFLISEALSHCYYQAPHLLLLLAIMSFLRIKSPEQLRGWSPGELGRLMGLDRILEVSTLRRYLDKVGALCAEWQCRMIKGWFNRQAVEEKDDKITLYIDGHVHVYAGDMTPLPKRYSTRHRLCVAGVTDYWVNDRKGRPLMRISRVIDEGLQQTTLKELIPLWEKYVPKPEAAYRETHPDWVWFRAVFDRAGSSPAFFWELKQHHIQAMTYQMRVKDEWLPEEFSEVLTSSPTGTESVMLLAERLITLSARNGEKVAVKEIRRMKTGQKSTHQTSIITTDLSIGISEGASLMFARWNQENYFKYMAEQFGLDHLLEYATASLSLSENVVNPRWRELEKECRKVQGKLDSLNRRFKRTYEELPEDGKGKAYEQKKAKRMELMEEIRQLDADKDELKKRLKEIPRKTTLGALEDNERFAALAEDRKMFVDVVKMAAYRAETSMAELVREYSDSYGDEARSILQRLYRQPADLLPDNDNKILNVRIYPLPEMRQCTVAEKLCEIMNESETCYPGTEWKLHYEMLKAATGVGERGFS